MEQKSDWFQRVPEKDFIGLLPCLAIFAVLAILFFAVFGYFEYESSRAKYEVDTTYDRRDAFGNKVYGKELESEKEVDLSRAIRPAGITGFAITLVIYLSNFSLGFRNWLGNILGSLFS
jgi:hypothetical protein